MTNSTHQTSGSKPSTVNQPYWMRLTALWLMMTILMTSFGAAWADTASVTTQSTTVSNGSSIKLPNPIKGPIDAVFTAADALNGVVGRKVCPPLPDSCIKPEDAKKARDDYAATHSCVFLQDTCKKTPVTQASSSPTSSSTIMKLWDGITKYIVDGYDFAKGIVEGLIQQIKDIWDLVTNITEVAEGLYELAKGLAFHHDDTIASLKKLLSKGAQEALSQATQCGAYDQGYLIGSYVSPGVALKFFGKLGKLGKTSKLGTYSEKIEKAVNDVVKTVDCNSFTAGTLVQTPQGNVSIQTVAVGNVVYSRDDKGMRDSTQEVTQTFTRLAPSYRTLTTELETIYVTDEHPLWVQGKGWTPAKDIREDDVVASRQGDMLILENTLVAKPAQVYNFSVYRTHSYFVGEAGLWAHNTVCPNPYLIKGVTFVVDKSGQFELNKYKLIAKDWLSTKGELLWTNPETNVKELMPVLMNVHVDHIFPQAKIKGIKGFDKLPPDLQQKLLNDPENLQPMPGYLNSSKGAKIESDANGGWQTAAKGQITIHPDYKKMLTKAETDMRLKVKNALIAHGITPTPYP